MTNEMDSLEKSGKKNMKCFNKYPKNKKTNRRKQQSDIKLMFLDSPMNNYIIIECLCNEDPLTPHFYIVKLGFTGVFIFFLFLL